MLSVKDYQLNLIESEDFEPVDSEDSRVWRDFTRAVESLIANLRKGRGFSSQPGFRTTTLHPLILNDIEHRLNDVKAELDSLDVSGGALSGWRRQMRNRSSGPAKPAVRSDEE